MDDQNTQFMFDIIDDFSNRVSKKFPAGKKEHGGNIWDMPVLRLLEETKHEFVDGYTYTYTLEHILKTLLADPVVKKRLKELFKK